MTRQQVEAGPTARTDAVPVPSAASRGAVGAVILAAALVGAAMLWGLWLRRDGVDLHLSGGQPLTGRYDWRLPIAALAPTVAGVAAVWLLPVAARRLGWAWLFAGSAAVASTWAVLLAATDGASALASPLATPFEYLRDIGRVGEVGPFLDSFTAHVPEDAQDFHWTTHVGGHPPGALLAFVGLDRLGLGERVGRPPVRRGRRLGGARRADHRADARGRRHRAGPCRSSRCRHSRCGSRPPAMRCSPASRRGACAASPLQPRRRAGTDVLASAAASSWAPRCSCRTVWCCCGLLPWRGRRPPAGQAARGRCFG